MAQAPEPVVARRMRLTPEDFRAHGYTKYCPGCTMLRSVSSARRNHTEACRTRMEKLIIVTPVGQEHKRKDMERRERELDKRLQQEDARAAGGEAPNAPEVQTADAPVPDTPRSQFTSDQAGDSPVRSSETQHPEEPRSRATRRAGDDLSEDRASKAARNTLQNNDSWSPNPKRFRGPPEGTTQAYYMAWMRANRFPASYGHDAPPPSRPESQHDGAESTHEDLRILSALLRGVDVMEIDSPPRVAEACHKYMLDPGESPDLQTGWDLSDRSEQNGARALVRARACHI